MLQANALAVFGVRLYCVCVYHPPTLTLLTQIYPLFMWNNPLMGELVSCPKLKVEKVLQQTQTDPFTSHKMHCWSVLMSF